MIAIVAIAITLLVIDEFNKDTFLVSSLIAILVVPTAIHISEERERKKRSIR